jgi:hypothetical protein
MIRSKQTRRAAEQLREVLSKHIDEADLKQLLREMLSIATGAGYVQLVTDAWLLSADLDLAGDDF